MYLFTSKVSTNADLNFDVVEISQEHCVIDK
mgnify:CR=1 FL=1